MQLLLYNRSHHCTVTHLHGSATVSPYDGWAENTLITNECKDFFYPNNDARGLWYHDHAIGKHTVAPHSTAVCGALHASVDCACSVIVYAHELLQ
jgi:hypothetical protein